MTEKKVVTYSPAHKAEYAAQNRLSVGLGVTLTQVDTVLIGKRTPVSLSSSVEDVYNNNYYGVSGQIISYSTSYRRESNVELPALDGGFSKDPVVTTLGYNYHYLGHKMFSPMHGRRLNIDLSKNRTFTNTGDEFATALECARAERLMIAAYPSTRSYFVSATFNRISSYAALINNSRVSQFQALVATYFYLAMRPYLSKTIRLKALDEMKNSYGVWFDDDAMMGAINDYIAAVFDRSVTSDRDFLIRNTSKAAKAIDSIVGKTDPSFRHAIGEALDSHLLSTCEPSRREEGGGNNGEQQQSLQMQAAQNQQDGQGQGGGEGQGEGQDGDGQGQEGEGEGQGDGDGDSEEEKDGQDGDGQSDTESQGNGGQGAGKGHSQSALGGAGPTLQEMIQEASEQAAEQAVKNEDSRRELEDIRNNTSNLGTFSKPITDLKFRKPDADYVLMQKQMAREFGKIIEDADPGFMTHQPSGRVSMKRAMHGIEDYDTAFDQWDEGKLSASSMEVTLLIDRSGSMRDMMPAACQSAWAIARGIESLGDNAKVNTFFFDDQALIVKRAHEKEGPQYRDVASNGGTDPATVLVDSLRILSDSKRAHKLCIILTDGVWGGDNAVYEGDRYSNTELLNSELVIREMRGKGITVGLANMMPQNMYERHVAYGNNLDHEADIVTRIGNPRDFVAFARSIVKEAMLGG